MIWTILLILIAAIVAAPFIAERLRKPMDGAARNDAPGDFVELTDGVTHIHKRGPRRGPWVVFVHGLTTPEFVWDDIANSLSEMSIRSLSYDLYGRGYSDRPSNPQDEAFFVRQLSEVLDAAEIPENFTLVGYSMGASIAVAYAAQNPDRVDRLVLLAPAGMTLKENKWADFLRDTPVVGDWLMKVVGGYVCKSGLLKEPEEDPRLAEVAKRQAAEVDYRGFLPAVLSSQRNLLRDNQTELHKQLEDKRVQTLAIWGEQDEIIPLVSLGDMTQANRGVHHDTVKGAGHGLPYTHPDRVVESIRTFFAETI